MINARNIEEKHTNIYGVSCMPLRSVSCQASLRGLVQYVFNLYSMRRYICAKSGCFCFNCYVSLP
jgi:hypothetical protein